MGKWQNDKIEKLKLHYKQFNLPSDQIIKDQEVLENFTSWFNTKFVKDEHFNRKEVADQLLRLRKAGNLPRLRT
jgi:hypothetical protein